MVGILLKLKYKKGQGNLSVKRPKVARRIYGCVKNISWFCDLLIF